MNVEMGIKAAKFLFWEYICGIFVAVYYLPTVHGLWTVYIFKQRRGWNIRKDIRLFTLDQIRVG
jgi:hypothetical protein